MGTTAQKLQKLVEGKQAIVDAVNSKASASLSINSKLSDVASAINNISSGSINISDATATANDILLGKTAYTADGKVEGTIETYNGENENGAILDDMLQLTVDSTKSCYYLFYNYRGDNVDFINGLNTSNVTNMSYMFYGCKSLISIPQLDTSDVNNMSYMFYECNNLTTIPQLDTSKVKNMEYMFYNCNKLTAIPQLDTSSVTNMKSMFYQCFDLTTIPQLDTSKVTSMEGAFVTLTKLTSLPRLDTTKVANYKTFVSGCRVLKLVDISYFYCSSSSYSNYMLYNDHSLRAWVIRSFGSSYYLNSNALTGCYHILGTTNTTYNPTGAKDGYIYVPRSMVDTLSQSTNWSTYADQFRALEDYTLDGTTTGELDLAKMGLEA